MRTAFLNKVALHHWDDYMRNMFEGQRNWGVDIERMTRVHNNGRAEVAFVGSTGLPDAITGAPNHVFRGSPLMEGGGSRNGALFRFDPPDVSLSTMLQVPVTHRPLESHLNPLPGGRYAIPNPDPAPPVVTLYTATMDAPASGPVTKLAPLRHVETDDPKPRLPGVDLLLRAAGEVARQSVAIVPGTMVDAEGEVVQGSPEIEFLSQSFPEGRTPLSLRTETAPRAPLRELNASSGPSRRLLRLHRPSSSPSAAPMLRAQARRKLHTTRSPAPATSGTPTLQTMTGLTSRLAPLDYGRQASGTPVWHRAAAPFLPLPLSPPPLDQLIRPSKPIPIPVPRNEVGAPKVHRLPSSRRLPTFSPPSQVYPESPSLFRLSPTVEASSVATGSNRLPLYASSSGSMAHASTSTQAAPPQSSTSRVFLAQVRSSEHPDSDMDVSEGEDEELRYPESSRGYYSEECPINYSAESA